MKLAREHRHEEMQCPVFVILSATSQGPHYAIFVSRAQTGVEILKLSYCLEDVAFHWLVYRRICHQQRCSHYEHGPQC